MKVQVATISRAYGQRTVVDIIIGRTQAALNTKLSAYAAALWDRHIAWGMPNSSAAIIEEFFSHSAYYMIIHKNVEVD